MVANSGGQDRWVARVGGPGFGSSGKLAAKGWARSGRRCVGSPGWVRRVLASGDGVSVVLLSHQDGRQAAQVASHVRRGGGVAAKKDSMERGKRGIVGEKKNGASFQTRLSSSVNHATSALTT
jgi:hypothetical protein